MSNESGQRASDAAAVDLFNQRALIIASNRGPITFNDTDSAAGDGPRFRRGAGGLVML